MLFNETHKHFICDKRFYWPVELTVIISVGGDEKRPDRTLSSSTVFVMEVFVCLNKRSESGMTKY